MSLALLSVLATLGAPAALERVDLHLSDRGRSAEVTLYYRVPVPGPVEVIGRARPVYVTQAGVDLDIAPDTSIVTIPRADAEVRVRFRVVGEPDASRSRRTLVESSHYFHSRNDPNTYAYEMPRAPLTVHGATALEVEESGNIVRASERRPGGPIGATFGGGLAVRDGEIELRGRGTIELLLSRDVIAAAAETDLTRSLSLALTYQLHSPLIPYFRLGGHAEAGPVFDLSRAASRVGGRVGGALHLFIFQLGVAVDLFDGGWRVGGCTTVGL